jgi:hypothetical protein
VITITDGAADCNIGFSLIDLTNIVTTKNIVMMARIRVTAQSNHIYDGKANMRLMPAAQAGNNSMLSLAYGAATGTGNVMFKGALAAPTTNATNNSNWNVYAITYYKDRDSFEWRVLGDRDAATKIERVQGNMIGAGCASNSQPVGYNDCSHSVEFGTGGFGNYYNADLAKTATFEVDWLKVANFD